MRALDLFCGAGGVARGLQNSGFYVAGVDIVPQPRYCGNAFMQGDAIETLRRIITNNGFDFIWASPVCKRYTAHVQQAGTADQYPDQIGEIRELLIRSGVPYCIENVPRAPLRNPVVLTGDMFGLNTYRKRCFECSFPVLAPEPGKPFGPKTRPGSVTVSGHSGGGGSTRDGWKNGNGAAWKDALGIDWMTKLELAQAIPPAYSEFIGRAFLAQRRSVAA